MSPSRQLRSTVGRVKAVMAGAACMVAVASAAHAQQALFDEMVSGYVTSGRFTGSVIVARDRDVVFSKGYAHANREWEIPNAPTTKFRLGSITKQFTAASILLLEEQGKVKLTERLSTYVPDTPPAWSGITLFHLLTHTSGIYNVTSLPEFRALKPFPASVEETVARVRDKALDFQPGEKFSYSNSGYLVLGHVIEKVSGQPYERFVQERILGPLGMKDSGYDSNSTIIPRRAAGYSPAPGGAVNAGFAHMSIPHAAGALYSTTEDLLRWQRGLYEGTLLSATSLRTMTTPHQGEYALGVIVRTVGGRRVISHSGGIDGFNTYLAYYPDTKTTVAVLANLNGPAADEIGAKLGALSHGEAIVAPGQRTAIDLKSETLARYLGTYEFAPGAVMLIRLESGQLTGQLTGQGRIPMFPESDTKFFVKVVDAQIEFGRDASGNVTHLVLFQNGVEQKARRTSATVQERKELAVAPQVLAAYAGMYELQAGFSIVVTVEGNQLMAQATGQPKLPLFGESETRFFYKAVDAQIDFVRGDAGAVTHLVLHQAGRDAKAVRR